MPNVRRPVRVQRIHEQRSVSQNGASVKCPVTGLGVPLSHCATCPRNQKAPSLAGAPAMMVCSVPDETGASAPAPWREQMAAILESTLVCDVMTQDVSCVTADISLERLTRIFDDRQIGCAPVVDASGALIGMVTKTDVVCEFFDFEHEPPTEVSEVMTGRPMVVRETSTLTDAVALLTTARHLPVLSAAGDVVGILSEHDIIRWLSGSPP